jgi:hypothetical protein
MREEDRDAAFTSKGGMLMAVTWFCPRCWCATGCEPVPCPECGYHPGPKNKESYEDKLINALFHPVRDRRMTAIETLGRMRSRPAVPVLWWLVQNGADPFTAREIVRALNRIGTPLCMLMIESMTRHSSVIVRRQAEMIVWSKMNSENKENVRLNLQGSGGPGPKAIQEKKR